MTPQMFKMTSSSIFFWRLFVFLVNFSYWFKFHVNIITGSRVITIFFYKGLTKNLESGNTTTWDLPNIWRLEQVRNTKFGPNVSYKMLPSAEKYQGYSFQFLSYLGKTNKGGKITN